MSLQNFRTYQLALELHQACEGLYIKGSMKDQFERALTSISLNLAEGSAKPTAKDRRKFYYIALGSLRGVQTILFLLRARNLIVKADTLGAHQWDSPCGNPKAKMMCRIKLTYR